MQPLTPYFREAGTGPGVVCLHANASTSSQWRALMDRLALKFHVLAADSYGSGRSPAWPMDRPLSLSDEARLLEPVFARAGDRFPLVGHSYGAAVALVAAIAQPHLVRALALYEPTLFALIDAQSPPPNAADGIRRAVADAAAALDANDPAEAAKHFIDFWMDTGTWDQMPDPRKGSIAASIINIGNWKNALFNEPTPLQKFSELSIPVLYMIGEKSPESSLCVARLLTRVLPQVEVSNFEDLGHMGPITHPDIVNENISRFLERA